MEVTVKKLEHSHLELTITVDSMTWEKAKKSALEKLKSQVNIPGFRKGHVPEKILLARYGHEMVEEYASEEAINLSYPEAIAQEKLQIVERPHDLEVLSKSPFSYKLVVAVLPEISIDDTYKTMKIKKEKVEVSDKDVESEIEALQKRMTTYAEDSTKKAAAGDKLTIDFEGFDPKDAKPLEGTQGKDAVCVIGEKMYVTGFEEALIGAKMGETKEFEVTFPADYFHEPFKNKAVKFVVTVTKVEKQVLPEINEEYVEKLTGKKQSVADFKSDLKKKLLTEKESAERLRQEDAYLDEAVKKYLKEDLPHSLVDQELEYMVSSWKEQIKSQGMKPEEYLMHIQKSEDDLRKEWHPDAHARAAKRFILSLLLEKENVKVTDADIEKEVDKIAERFENPDHKAKLKEIYANKATAREQMEGRLQIQKFFDTILA
ncbi:MAG: trigger factor [Candidatus Gracilibacteria bacterium]